MFSITPKKEHKFYEARKQLSRFLVYLARKIEPSCPYAYTKYLEEMLKAQMDMITYGTGALKVEYVPFGTLDEGESDE